MRKKWSSPLAAIAAAALLLGLSPASPVTQQPAKAEGSCEFHWGIKESYRKYIKGQVAKGGWGADGIGFTGSETGPDGAFVFTPSQAATISGDTVTFNFGGTLKFNGHNYGGGDLLDMTLTDFKVRASGNTAEIMVDYVSYESDMVDKTTKGDQITGNDEVIATINLNNPVDASSGSVDLSGTTNLTSGGERLFLAYNTGEVLDPTSGVVSTSCASGGGSSSGGTSTSGSGGTCGANTASISGNFSGFNKEIMDILIETNDTLNGFNKFMCNTEAFLDSYESFMKRTGNLPNSNGNNNGTGTGTTTTASGNSGTTTASGGTGTASTGTSGTSGTSGASAASGTTGTTRSAGGSGSTDTCEAATGVINSTAAWGIKQSFQSYITGSIAKGKWELNGITHNAGKFQFPGNSGNVDTAAKSGSIRYNGGVQFTGHNGVLDLNISNIEITFNGNSGQLIADVRSSDMEGNRTDFGRTTVATLQFSNLDITDNSANGTASTFLSAEGAKAFADFYEPGLELDPISFEAQLGGQGDCSGSGGSSSGASASGSNGSNNAAGNAEGNEGTTTGYENGASNFQIKSAAASTEEPMTYLALLIAGLVIAGGSTARLVMRNPS